MLKIKAIEQKNRPWVIAHRGYRGVCPENTISAFKAAIEVKADMIELDVCLTRDRVPVVIHDATLERTTDGKGLVSEYTLSELNETVEDLKNLTITDGYNPPRSMNPNRYLHH